ncbi:hypothetical protein [Nonomuraea dietziae]|uniref:hypothetical protein n=1 Tax=Nonomuraea dietziae TaxID=65515 RepID=UPI0031D47DC7
MLVVLGVVLGTAAGSFVVTSLIDLQGHTSGVGAGIGRPPSALTLTVAVTAAVGAAPRGGAASSAPRGPRPAGNLRLQCEPVEAVTRQG